MSEPVITVNVDDYLALNKYEVDEENPHIVLVDDPDKAEFSKLIRVCPAALYKRNEAGEQTFDYAGCLECGTCLVVCPKGAVTWAYPEPGYGIRYRFG